MFWPRRLHERGPIAFQINQNESALFRQDGVTLHSTYNGCAPKGTWALSDSSGGQHGLNPAFQHLAVHVIHMSSPSSSRQKNWVKHLGAPLSTTSIFGKKIEDTYECEVNAAAVKVAREFSKGLPQLEDLDDFASKIFTVRPTISPEEWHAFEIPTSFLRRTFGLALSRQVVALRQPNNTLFSMLSGHPSVRHAVWELRPSPPL
ncbi:hypothetical protein AX14_001093 [Amanita brunnescens Koide BX004]|nr:hypothetical protein AX14_001093 [Amanita brunnescens Koide BX004]